MYLHHQEAITVITNKLKTREDVLGIIVGGSVAHGYAKEDSDIDLMLVVSDEDFRARLDSGDVSYYEKEATPYEGGYVDGKYTSISYIRQVAESGSEPARFAYRDAIVTYSEVDGLEELVAAASQYPKARKEEMIEKFYAQFEGWKWLYYEGAKRNETYLMEYAIPQFVLFAGRLILAHNEVVYPYHKWFMTVLGEAIDKPEGLIEQMDAVLKTKSPEHVEQLFDNVNQFRTWPKNEKGWHVRFMLDSELNWLSGYVPIADA
ncbi:nucleotidyltransferase domain-containing protein [Paenibacillus massiliensis]|uniref:nucleotidyltransferase domain-containing protein n=1 Tax=Paenibacillus massiliensis TaxID=225917 RepID=UPI00041858E7|nr:nucleotidyltransferase domain-containing protein [Paenibacillus massiliensis]